MDNRHGIHRTSILALAVAAALTLLAGPGFALTVSPGAVVQGDTAPLSISTPGTNWSQGVTVDLGEGLTVTGIEVLDPELLLVIVEASMNAPLGAHNIMVQQDGVYAIGADALTVMQPGNGNIPAGHGSTLDVNIITNPGFETGDMTGWIPVTWTIDTVLPHSGVYDAHDAGASGGGGLCLRQEFVPPIDSNTISSFTFWLRQPDDFGIAQVAVWYQSLPTQYGVAFTNDDDTWTFESFPGLILPNDYVTAIHVCGFGGGAPTPDDSWADDFDMEATGTPAQITSWGRIKGLYR